MDKNKLHTQAANKRPTLATKTTQAPKKVTEKITRARGDKGQQGQNSGLNCSSTEERMLFKAQVHGWEPRYGRADSSHTQAQLHQITQARLEARNGTTNKDSQYIINGLMH